MQYTQYILLPFTFELFMNIKLSISLLLFFGVISGCSNDNNVNTTTDDSDSNVLMQEGDEGYGEVPTNPNTLDDQFQDDLGFEERGDIISDDLAVNPDSISVQNGEDLFEIQIYSKLNEGREYARNNIESARNFPPEYDTFISFTSDYEGQFTFNEVVVNKGQSCRMIMNLPVTMGYGQKTQGRTDCDEDQVRHLLVQTDLGNFEFGPN